MSAARVQIPASPPKVRKPNEIMGFWTSFVLSEYPPKIETLPNVTDNSDLLLALVLALLLAVLLALLM